MSSTYAVREIQEYFQSLSPTDYYYKECAINARSPENEADAYESAFIAEMNADPELVSRSGIRVIDGQPFFVTLRRGEVMEETCLRCHSTPDVAPDGLVNEYGPVRSFDRELGEVASAISIRTPLSAAYAEVNRFSWRLSGVLLILLFSLFGVQFWLYRRLLFIPLIRIHDKALQISRKEEHLGEEIPLPVGRELSELTAAFNAMSIGLRRNRDQLEERVVERTAELERLNTQLQQDIAERERAEEALRASEERYRELFDNMSSGVAVYKVLGDGEDFVFQDFNKAGESIDGDKKEDLFGRSVFEARPGIEGFGLIEVFRNVWKTGNPEHHPVTLYKDERLVGWYENFVYKLSSGEIVAVFDDVTERKQAEIVLQEYSERLKEMVEERTRELEETQEQLVRQERLAMLGKLAGSVAHELRNPLGVLSNATYYLQMVLGSDGLSGDMETVREYLEIISKEVYHSERIISDLLDVSRTKMPEREKAIAFDLVAQVLEKRPPPANVEVTMMVDRDLPALYVDPRQIGQVLDNLVANAYQAMPEGGELTISAQVTSLFDEQSEGEVKALSFSVTDTGFGISPEHLTKIFEPLFTTKTQGIGLGLMLSKSFVEANGGSIEVESKEGIGSTFTVRLPIWKARADSIPAGA
jgi:PAS domain S-box-containing protein